MALPPRLAGAPARQKLDYLLSLRDPGAFIRALPPDDLTLLVSQIGLQDCADLVALASPEQLAGAVDLDAWSGGGMDEERLFQWADLAKEAGGLGRVAGLYGALDPEALSLLLRRHAAVHDRDDPRPEVTEGTLIFATPDEDFFLECQADDPVVPYLRDMLAALYGTDIALGRQVVMCAKWDTDSRLEEACAERRSKRLEDLGFMQPEEAAEMFVPLPAAEREQILREVDRMAGTLVPAWDERSSCLILLRAAEGSDLLSSALGALGPGPELETFGRFFSYLVHRAISADRLAWGEETVEAAARLVSGGIAIGLEIAAGGDAGKAAEVLRLVLPASLFRIGYTEIASLASEATILLRRATVAGVCLLDPPCDDVVRGLGARRPVCAETIVEERRGAGFRSFRLLADVDASRREVRLQAAAASVLDEVVGRPAIVQAIAAISEGDRAHVRLSTLVNTVLANAAAGRGDTLRPLSEDEVRSLLITAVDSSGARGRVQPRLRAGLAAWKRPPGDKAGEMAAAFAARCLDSLEEALSGLRSDQPVDTRFLGNVLLFRR